MTDARNLIDTEALVLGTILQGGEPAFREVAFLTADDFGVEKHRIVFGAITGLVSEVHPTIDAVAEKLRERDKLDAVGGLSGLVDLDQCAIPGTRLAGFARILRRLAVDRRAYLLSQRLSRAVEMGYHANTSEIAAITEELRSLQPELETDVPTRTFGQCLKDAGGIDTLCALPRNLVPLAWSGAPVMGFQPGQLIVGAGPTGAGKTILAVQQSAHAAKRGLRTLFISLEMSTPEILRRFLSMIARVRHADLQQGTLKADERRKVEEAAAQLDSWPLEITTATRSIDSIRSKISEERRCGNPYRLAVIDYLQLITASQRFENRVQEVSLISRSLRTCAAESECVVLALSQLSRAPESRSGDHEPRLSDLRDSGSIEQDADVVIFVHRPGFYKPGDESMRNVVRLIVRKHRNGAVGAIDLVWVPKYVMFAQSTHDPVN